jgi:hypothetical protein
VASNVFFTTRDACECVFVSLIKVGDLVHRGREIEVKEPFLARLLLTRMRFLRSSTSQKCRLGRVLLVSLPSFFVIHQNATIRQSASSTIISSINYQSVSAVIDSMMTTKVDEQATNNTSTTNAALLLVLDVASVGSNTRLEYMKAQQETWASQNYIRHFFETTEDDDVLPNCTISTFATEQDIKSHVNFCRRSHKRHKFKHLYHYLHAQWVLHKAHPAGWLCAQHRPGTALYKALQRYKNKNTTNDDNSSNDSLPDYLMLVDDDTYYDIPRLTPLLQETCRNNVATVYVGCLTILKSQLIQNLYRAAPFGGGGVILSKQTLQRLLMPMHCPADPPNDDDDDDHDHDNHTSTTHYDDSSWCRQLDLNLLGERDVFRNGMTMGELIYQFYNRHPNCYISDWPLAYFIQYYHLADVPWLGPGGYLKLDKQQQQQQQGQERAKQTVLRIRPITAASVQLFYDDPEWKQQQQNYISANITNLCPLLQDAKTEYPPGVLVGHYLSPNKMLHLYNQSKQ